MIWSGLSSLSWMVWFGQVGLVWLISPAGVVWSGWSGLVNVLRGSLPPMVWLVWSGVWCSWSGLVLLVIGLIGLVSFGWYGLV